MMWVCMIHCRILVRGPVGVPMGTLGLPWAFMRTREIPGGSSRHPKRVIMRARDIPGTPTSTRASPRNPMGSWQNPMCVPAEFPARGRLTYSKSHEAFRDVFHPTSFKRPIAPVSPCICSREHPQISTLFPTSVHEC